MLFIILQDSERKRTQIGEVPGSRWRLKVRKYVAQKEGRKEEYGKTLRKRRRCDKTER
jgi:hypothetical protein